MTNTHINWAGNLVYSAPQILEPEHIEQIQELVQRSSKLKALGTRHSFNEIADSPGDIISLRHFSKVLELDAEARTVTVEAGVRYGELCRWLDAQGFALHNLASLPHISVAGACATATHGSGDANRNLSSAVTAMEIITASGERTLLGRNDPEFEGAVVSLGALGIVTKLTLAISPTFQMQQDVYENLSLANLESHFDEIFSDGYSVSLFTDWKAASVNHVWVKKRAPDNGSMKAEPELFGAKLATRNLHPISALSAENCTAQLGSRGPWYERLPHFRLEFTPSSGEELQSEYILPRRHSLAAFRAIDGLRERVAPLLQISEIRTIAADTLWMSPCYRQDCVALHFTWKKDWDSVKQLLPMIEERLSPFEARPHWGKLFMMQPEQLKSLYEKLPQFRQVLERHDPTGKFRNSFLDRYIF